MPWLATLFHDGSVAGSLLILGLVGALGLLLGSLRVRGISLGIAGVLFSGIVFGHYRAVVAPEILDFARELGLVLFVYCVGVQVGPGFLASLRKSGLHVNLVAAGIVFAGAGLAVAIGRYGHVPMAAAVGLFSGGTTNTPSLGAAQAALRELPGYTDALGRLPGLGYAVAYPFGVLGLIAVMLLSRRFFNHQSAEPATEATPPPATEDFEAAAPEANGASSVQALPLFLGLAVGVALGNAPIPISGLPAPLRLGMAAGPMLVAIALSSVPRLGPLTWRMPEKANLLLREIAIVIFLACVGVRAGDKFVETLLQGDGFRWMAFAALITFFPPLLAALVARYALKLRYHFACGVLAGSMTDPPALAFAASLSPTQEPMLGYATVYPLTQLLRALSAQLIVLLFVRP
jgi:AspT/YidE/YbjL antiporter-like protein